MTGRLLRFRTRSEASEEDRAIARQILSVPVGDRLARAAELELEKPENLLALCAYLHEQHYTSPESARQEAEFLYRFLEMPRRTIGLFDERDYFLGELALIAGTACRQVSRRQEAWVWFDRAELAFRHTANAPADLSRLAYQRLALRIEERQFDVVFELAPALRESFEVTNMPEEALKCRFLEGIALVETGRLNEAIPVFEQIASQAEEIGSERLLASAYANLTHYQGMRGDSKEAIAWSEKAIPILQRLDDRVGLAKTQWGLANLLRKTNRTEAAVETYRAAQAEFARLEMRADVAALSLVVADLLLELSRDQEARREILSALPVIDELKMVPEGVAAFSLLRESLRQKRINRQALRDLHGFFEESDG